MPPFRILIKAWFPQVVAGFTALVFLDSLRYKFTNSPETQTIFGKLDAWATHLGAPGLFAQSGLFSQYVIGTAELLAALLLLLGVLPTLRRLQTIGFLLAFAVMSGAVSFHLFTPLGVDPNQDGGGLFMAAITIWATCFIMLVLRRKTILQIACGIWKSLQVPVK